MRDSLEQILTAPWTRLNDINQQTFWLTYLGTLVVAVLYYHWRRHRRRSSLRGLWRYLFPRALLRHPSTRLDLKFYLFSSMYLMLQTLLLFSQFHLVSPFLSDLLTTLLGTTTPSTPPLALALLLPVLLLLGVEFGYWLAHYSMHRLPWLWEFHKIHHNAEVMTPLTEWRQHPVEYLWFPLVIGSVMAVPYGIIEWAYGPDPAALPFWNATFLFLIFNATIGHLRHSHVKMSCPRWLAHCIQTPAHHHIHHSRDPKHFDKNMGFSLALWDWAFGTLYLPEKNQHIRFGIQDEGGAEYRLGHQLIAPFRALYRKQR